MKQIRYWMVAVGSAFLMVSVSLGTTCLSFFVAPVTKELGYSRSTFTVYFSVMTIVAMLTTPFVGKAIHKYGVRKIGIAGGLCGTAGFVGLSFCSSMMSFYIAGAVLGVFLFGCTQLNAAVAVSTWFVAKRGTIMGIVMSASGLGGGLFSLVLPGFIAAHGWRNGYLFLSVAWFIFTVPVSLLLLTNKPQDVGLEPYGKAQGRTQKAIQSETTGISYSTALRTPPLYLLMCANLLLCAVAGMLQHLPAFYMGNGMTLRQIGSLMSILMIAMIVAKVVLGIASDKFGFTWPVVGLTVLFVASFLLMPTKSYAVLAVSMICMSFGNGSLSVMPPLFTAQIFGQKDYAKLWALASMSATFGTAIGPPIWGLVYDTTKSYLVGLYIAPVLILAGSFFWLYALKAGRSLSTPRARAVATTAR